jgi:hypothetical protein
VYLQGGAQSAPAEFVENVMLVSAFKELYQHGSRTAVAVKPRPAILQREGLANRGIKRIVSLA